ncbi:MAG TPA: ABC transporter permease subunit [Candidatus Poseidoniia archaeon]|jgi:ABC-type transport system involved in multi-copper enzyme maturation permease subunit|nr:ABC transporter permease subunit [Candidatus Poseidoniia archaeon]|tara:strand:+ start:791 stop:2281 length:1491 start_codon:yes stop_codon:yes gene_type:complete
MRLKENVMFVCGKKWKENYTWQPLFVAIFIILIIATTHKAHWEMTTETNPLGVWNERKIVEHDNMTTITYNDETLVNKTTTFKGVLEIFPYTNTSIGSIEQSKGTFDEMDGLVYSEDTYKKCMISLNGMRILVNGSLEGKFYKNEVVTVDASLVEKNYIYERNGAAIKLESQIWEAEIDDIALADERDYYFFGVEFIIFAIGLYFSLNRIKNLKEQIKFAKHIAMFEFRRGLKTPRMIVLGLIFFVFIVGMGMLLGQLQNDPDSILGTMTTKGSIVQLSYFTFMIGSMVAIGVSVDTFHKERQENTMNLLLARPINRETIVFGKALGLTLVVGIPAFIAQVIGLYFMVTRGEMPPIGSVFAFLFFGQVMIFTMVTFQLCLAISARSGSSVVIYGLSAWLLFALVWALVVIAMATVIGVDINGENFENDPDYQQFASRIGLLNPGVIYQMVVGLFTSRTLAVDLEGVPGWLALLSVVLWPLMCLRTATWLFKREMKG